MTATFKHRGDAIDYIPDTDVAAGSVVVQGELVGVAALDIRAGMFGSLTVSGVFAFPKPVSGGVTFSAGVKVYWDEAAGAATEDPNGGVNKYLGKTTAAAANSDAAVRVRLDQ